jgi:hypothetical protein
MAKKPEKKKPTKAPIKPTAKKTAAKKPVVAARKAVAKPAKKAVAKKPVKAAPAKKAVPAKKLAKKAEVPPPKKPVAVAKKVIVRAGPTKAGPTKSGPTKPVPAKPVTAKKSKVEEDDSPEILLDPAVEASESTETKAPSIEVADGSDHSDDAPEEVILTDAEGRRYCRVRDCDQLSSVDGYCRYHYLLFWKKIQIRKKILSEGKLERYVEELTARYPDKFLEMLRKDLRSEKEFLAAIQELEIDESAMESELEDETQTYIDEVRGMAEPGAREEEDF